MKTIKYLFVACFLFIAGNSFTQKLIAVTSGNNSSFYKQIDSAIYYAQDGDFVYLPGGNFTISQLVIDKRLTIIGAGHHPDSSSATGITFINGNVHITDGASNGSLSGVYISGNLYYGTNSTNMSVQNYTIERCNVNSVYLSFDGVAYNTSSTTTNFRHNIMRGTFNGGDARDVHITNNIMVGAYYHLYFVTAGDVSNNIFINGSFNEYIKGTTFQNNIFLSGMNGNATPGTSSNNLYYNNAYVGSALSEGGNGALIVQGNVQFSSGTVLVNQSGSTFSYTQDYHLQQTVNGLILGLDGLEVGIYGGSNPYKEGAIPFNPHISSKVIGNSTNPSGQLPVSIQVNAQSH
jgi:hypothetical protein